MDHPGGLGGRRADRDLPGAGLLGPGGQERLQPERAEPRGRELGQPRLAHPGLGEQLGGLVLGQLRQVGFGLGVKEDRLGGRDERGELLAQPLVRQVRDVHVEHVQERLGGQQVQLTQRPQRDPGGRRAGEERRAVVQHVHSGGGRGAPLGPFRILTEFCLFDQPGQRPVQSLQVGQYELGDDRLDVAFGVGRALHPGHVGVGEDPDDLADRVGLADVAEELVAKALPLRRAADQAGDVGEPHGGGHDTGAVVQPGQRGEPGIRDADDADVGLDRGERVVRGQRPGPRQRVEQGGLADVGQADDSDGQAHRTRV